MVVAGGLAVVAVRRVSAIGGVRVIRLRRTRGLRA